MTRVLTSLMTLTALISFRPPAAEGADGAAGVKGVWVEVSASIDGVKVLDDPTAGARVSAYDGSHYVRRQGADIVEEGTYEADGSVNPGTIAFSIARGPDAGKRQLGIFEVTGDTLRVCLSEPGDARRPKTFDAGSGRHLVVNRRYRP